MSKYLIFPRLEVNRANALATGGVVSMTPVMAATMLGVAFEQRCDLGFEVTGVMLVHHHAELMAERALKQDDFHGDYNLIHIKGATLFNKGDLPSTYKAGRSLDYAVQPTVLMRGQWSVVLRLTDEISDRKVLKAATQFLHAARFAGGDIVSYGRPVVVDELPSSGSVSEFEKVVRSGFVVSDASHLLSDRPEGMGRVEHLLRVCSERSSGSSEESGDPNRLKEGSEDMEEGASRFFRSPAVLGYALISMPGAVVGSRNDAPHAFCEPMLGVVGLSSIRKLKEARQSFDHLFWAVDWLASDVLAITQPISGVPEKHSSSVEV